jgi:predicted transcriptional regulator
MTTLPRHRPKQLSLGRLELEILNIVWDIFQARGAVSVKDVHEQILADPDRDLAYTSVTTVLQRLTQKGWLACDKVVRPFAWRPLISRQEAQSLEAYLHLQRFLAVSNPDIVAAFADNLDQASVEQLTAIAAKLKAMRQNREASECT